MLAPIDSVLSNRVNDPIRVIGFGIFFLSFNEVEEENGFPSKFSLTIEHHAQFYAICRSKKKKHFFTVNWRSISQSTVTLKWTVFNRLIEKKNQQKAVIKIKWFCFSSKSIDIVTQSVGQMSSFVEMWLNNLTDERRNSLISLLNETL